MDVVLVCGGIIEKDGKLLLVQEGKQVARGLWNLPGGKLEPGESIIEGALREIKEETGFAVKLDGLVGVYQINYKNDNLPRFHFRFKASIISGKLKIQKGEILDAKWFSPQEILAMDETNLRSPVIKACVRDYLSGKLYPVDAIKYLK